MYVSPRDAAKVQARKAAVHKAEQERQRRENLAKMARVAKGSK